MLVCGAFAIASIWTLVNANNNLILVGFSAPSILGWGGGDKRLISKAKNTNTK